VTTNGEGPYWLKNLYFVYLLELRALAKAAPYLRKQTYFTGIISSDANPFISRKRILIHPFLLRT
jgi:ERO1-like protein alpha